MPAEPPPAVVFAMRYPDDIGLVWASMARVYDAAAEYLPGPALVAYPTLTGRAVYPPTRLRPVRCDFYDPSPDNRNGVREVVAGHNVRAVVYFGGDPVELDLPYVRALGARTVNYDQNSYPPSGQPWHKWAAKVLLRRVLRRNLHDLYLANADHQRAFLIRHAGLPPGRVRTVANGIDPVRFAPGPPPDPVAIGLPPGGRYVVAVCQARAEKRIDFLIDAAAEYLKAYPDDPVTFAHVGDGPALAGWAAHAAARGLGGRFVFAGVRHDVAPVLRLATVFAHTAARESFGFAVAEAMAVGVPVVATDSPGPAELLRGGECGTVVPPGDAGAFAAALRPYLADAALRAAAGAAGRRRVEQNYTLARQATELAAAVRSVLG